MAKKKPTPDLPIVAQIRERLRVAPFHGLDVKTSDGETIRVIHQDYIFIEPNGQVVLVYDEEQVPYILNARQIVAVTPVRPRKEAS